MANEEIYQQGLVLIKALEADTNNLVNWRNGIENKWFRLNTFYDIKSDEGEVLQFRCNDAQIDLFRNQHTRDITLKARQLGFTTFEMISALDDCLFIDNFTAACIAHTVDAVRDIFDNKVKFAYESINKELFTLITDGKFSLPTPMIDRANAYKFSNGSKIQVGTGFRSGTLQKLHVSEFGKICKKHPDKAKEIVTGSFEAVSKFSRISIESTAEGREGKFYELVESAKGRIEQSSLQFKLHFYPWWGKSENTSENGGVSDSLTKYFEELEYKHGIKLSEDQKRWYSAKKETLGDDIYREHPSTEEEAFKVSIEGAYYANEFADIYKSGRIGEALNTDHSKVCTAWDLGTSDSTSIWFYEHIGNEIHFIDYYENSGYGLEHYLKVVNEKPYNYQKHYGPHDINNRQYASKAKTLKDLAAEGMECDGRIYKLIFDVVPKIGINDGIAHSRQALKRSYFYEKETEQGVKCLENYRRDWDDKVGCFKDSPKHDWSSHGSDSYRYLSTIENKKEVRITARTMAGAY